MASPGRAAPTAAAQASSRGPPSSTRTPGSRGTSATSARPRRRRPRLDRVAGGLGPGQRIDQHVAQHAVARRPRPRPAARCPATRWRAATPVTSRGRAAGPTRRSSAGRPAGGGASSTARQPQPPGQVGRGQQRPARRSRWPPPAPTSTTSSGSGRPSASSAAATSRSIAVANSGDAWALVRKCRRPVPAPPGRPGEEAGRRRRAPRPSPPATAPPRPCRLPSRRVSLRPGVAHSPGHAGERSHIVVTARRAARSHTCERPVPHYRGLDHDMSAPSRAPAGP